MSTNSINNPRHDLPAGIPLDVVGIGFGPSNIALAISLREMHPSLNAVFFEAQPQFGWHDGMMFRDATMQVSFLKDLASYRNPRSHFSFVNYLHAKERLADFANKKDFFPSRTEFRDYLRWCAGHFEDQVRYGHRVVRICEAGHCREGHPLLRVVVRHGDDEREVLARAVVHAGGLAPTLPGDLTESRHVTHVHHLLRRREAEPPEKGARYVVVGGGQSAAETVDFLHQADPECSVTALFSRFGYTPADDSPFVNQIFDPASVDDFYFTSPAVREHILALHASTNYAAVDLGLIDKLFRTWYEEKVAGTHRLRFERLSRFLSAEEIGAGVRVHYQDLLSGTTNWVDADHLVCATGFAPRSVCDLLAEPLASRVLRNTSSQPEFTRSYRLRFSAEPSPPVYAVDMCEPSHGLTATLISNMAVRSGEIVTDIAERLAIKHRKEGLLYV